MKFLVKYVIVYVYIFVSFYYFLFLDLNLFNLELGMEGEFRSVDLVEDFLFDYLFLKLEGEKSLICFIGGEDDDDDDGYQSEGMEEVDWNKL